LNIIISKIENDSFSILFEKAVKKVQPQ